MSEDLRKIIEELKQRRDNLDAVIKILEDEVCPEEARKEKARAAYKKKRRRPGFQR